MSLLLALRRHQMETFPALLTFCAKNSSVTGEFPAQRPVTRNFDVFFDLRLKKNGWINNREAGDLRRHRAYYDVTVMACLFYANDAGESELTVLSQRLYGNIEFSEWNH